MTHIQFCCLVCGVLVSWKLLPNPKGAEAILCQKNLLFDLWSSSRQLLKVLHDAGADPSYIGTVLLFWDNFTSVKNKRNRTVPMLTTNS